MQNICSFQLYHVKKAKSFIKTNPFFNYCCGRHDMDHIIRLCYIISRYAGKRANPGFLKEGAPAALTPTWIQP